MILRCPKPKFLCQQKAVIHAITSIGISGSPGVQILSVLGPQGGWGCFSRIATVQILQDLFAAEVGVSFNMAATRQV